MAMIKDIIRRKKDNAPAGYEPDMGLFSLQNRMNSLFNDFFHGTALKPFEEFDNMALTAFSPKINVAETDKEVAVTAELPGMDEKDVNVELNEGTLTISGEKKEEHEEKGKNWHRVERSYGSFHRVVQLPARVDEKQARAKFKKGLLTVTLPKLEKDQGKRKTIEIKSE